MTKIKTNIFKILLIVLGLVLTSSFFYSSAVTVNAETVGGSENPYESNNYTSSYETVIYSRMDITLDIKRDSTMTFTYDFDVCANTNSITEFYFIFPYREFIYRDVDNDGTVEKEEYYAKLSNESLVKGQDGDEILKRYVDDVENNYLTIGVKNPDGYYVKGDIRNYKVSFDYDMVFNYQEGFDEVYINLLGSSYLKLRNVSFTINLPKDVDFASADFTPYVYGATMGSNKVSGNFQIVGNSIKSVELFDVDSGYALTYRQLLPEGYFDEKEEKSNFWIYFMIGTTIVLGLVLVSLKFKSKPDKIVVPVQLEMPNMLPADAELVHSHKITKKSLGATIIYLANLGFVKIETMGEDCEPNKIIKVKDLPADFDGRTKRIFERVFKNDRTEVYLDDFGTLSLYERIHSYKVAKESSFNENAYTSQSRKFYNISQVLDIFAVLIPILLYMLHLKSLVGFVVDNIYGCFITAIMANIMVFVVQTIKEKILKIFLSVFAIFLSAAIFFQEGFDVFGGINAMLICYFVLFAIGLLPIYKKYTKETIEKVRVVRGVKNYIEKVEKSRIEKLIMENPTVYYDILPFAYVLGVSDKWINAFEDIIVTPPEWVVGDTPYVHFHSRHMTNMCRGINRNMSSFVNSNRAAKFASSSGGGGGGFSGGGGGGFSGGGGGGASFGGR